MTVSRFSEVMTKSEAKKILKAAGLGFHSYGESGDYGPNSREYWVLPGAELNKFGFPLQTVNISKMGRGWVIYGLEA